MGDMAIDTGTAAHVCTRTADCLPGLDPTRIRRTICIQPLGRAEVRKSVQMYAEVCKSVQRCAEVRKGVQECVMGFGMSYGFMRCLLLPSMLKPRDAVIVHGV